MIVALAAVAGLALTVAALLALVRVVRGPTVLNRVVALDVLISVAVSMLGLEAAYNQHTTTVPIVVSLGLIGFVGTTSVARFAARRDDRVDEPHAPTTLGAPGAVGDPGATAADGGTRAADGTSA